MLTTIATNGACVQTNGWLSLPRLSCAVATWSHCHWHTTPSTHRCRVVFLTRNELRRGSQSNAIWSVFLIKCGSIVFRCGHTKWSTSFYFTFFFHFHFYSWFWCDETKYTRKRNYDDGVQLNREVDRSRNPPSFIYFVLYVCTCLFVRGSHSR